VYLPSLRERKDDIPELAEYSFNFYKNLYHKTDLAISDSAINKLLDHNWPGNVRELRNVIERTVLLTTSNKVTAKHISDSILNGRVTAGERRYIQIDIPKAGIKLQEIEKQVISEILNMVNWNRSEAARILGISRARLRRIMDENKLHEDRRKNS